MRKAFGLISVFLLPLVLLAQPQRNHWFFPSGLGFDFSGGSPAIEPGGKVIVQEGCSSMSDSNGHLLFYTDGMTVWNRNHQAMPNGTDLDGKYGSSSQSSLIVPKSEDGQQYYIFTAAEEGDPLGLKYSVVDMNQNGGLGDVVSKNIPLVTPVCEKLTAVLHCNGVDYWIIAHAYGSDAYYAFRAGPSGVNPVPVITHLGFTVPRDYQVMAGCFKGSPDGKRIAGTFSILGTVLLDFDNQTGILSNLKTLIPPYAGGLDYGLEFSPNGHYLYAGIINAFDLAMGTYVTRVCQFDVSLPDEASMAASASIVYEQPYLSEIGSFQAGPDGKIYIAHYNETALSVIDSPNLGGNACAFQAKKWRFSNFLLYGLPNFAPNRQVHTFNISSVNGKCAGDSVLFDAGSGENFSGFQWDFGDPVSGNSNTDTGRQTRHLFREPGNYTVSLIRLGPCGNDTALKTVKIETVSVNLGNDSSFCGQVSQVLDPRLIGNYQYLWQDGSTQPKITAQQPGLYWVKVTNNSNSCTGTDSILLAVKPYPLVQLGNDTGLCPGRQWMLSAGNPGGTYLWQDQSVSPQLLVTQAGLYWVQVTVDGCSSRDSIRIEALSAPHVDLGPDGFICEGQPRLLKADQPGALFLWQDGSTEPNYLARQEGLYYVTASNSCGSYTDSIRLQKGNCQVRIPNAFTPNADGKNDIFRILGTQTLVEFKLSIYNRWGQLVYQSVDKNSGWDGTINGRPAEAGVYVFLLQYRDAGATKPQVSKGNVVLLR